MCITVLSIGGMNVSTIMTDSVTINVIGDVAITSYLLSYYQSGEQKLEQLLC